MLKGMKSIYRLPAICSLFFVLQGCATSSLFTAYPDQAVAFQKAVESSNAAAVSTVTESTTDTTAAPLSQDAINLNNVLADLAEEKDDADGMLYMMERGRITQLNSRYSDSKADFAFVIEKFEETNLASTIEAGDVAAQGSSLLVNDNVIPYKGAGYERVFTHHHQAFNYLGERDFEGASVEFRKVALEQRVLLEKHEKEVAEAYEEAKENKINVDTLSGEFSGLDNVAGKVKSSFQNAYTFYASAAFWEATGELNSAIVDYKKALEINSSSDLIKQDIARVAKKQGDRVSRKDLNEPKSDEGVVVVFFEDGFVPSKSEIKIPLPTFDGGFISLAFPYYKTDIWPVSLPLKAVGPEFNELGVSEVVVDVGALAVKDLKEQLPAILVRQALRAIAKYQLQKESGKQLGFAGQLAASAYNIISESADRRSWLTLPNTAQVMRFNLKEGATEINFSTPLAQTKLPLDIKAKRTTFIRVVNANNHLITQVYAL